MSPICERVGSRPIAVVAPPITSMVRTRERLRPTRSPMCPKMMAPGGRTMYPTARVPSAATVATSGDRLLKNSGPSTSVAMAV